MERDYKGWHIEVNSYLSDGGKWNTTSILSNAAPVNYSPKGINFGGSASKERRPLQSIR
jgi:hypothetical protein